MEIYDTHAHFDAEGDAAGAIARAREAGVARIMAVGGSPELNAAAEAARNVAPAAVRLAVGWDRDQIALDEAADMDSLRGRLVSLKCAALGETGLDFHYSPETARAQERLFAAQCELAEELALPIVVHTRDADDSTLGILRETGWSHDRCRGVIHCFTGSVPFERKLLDLGFMVSISGIVTFRAAENVREAARYVPDDRLLVETDSPFLAPVPMRGRANEPAFIVHTVEFLASLRGVEPDVLAALTYANAAGLFG